MYSIINENGKLTLNLHISVSEEFIKDWNGIYELEWKREFKQLLDDEWNSAIRDFIIALNQRNENIEDI